MEEIWKDIKGFEGKYQVSNLGRVRGFVRVKGKILGYHKNADGYLQSELRENKKKRRFYTHRLVAKAFLPNPNNLPEVNHIDENKENNRIDNLEWCTHEYNITYGTLQQRSADSRLKDPILQYDIDGNLIATHANNRAVKELFGEDNGIIARCCGGYINSYLGYIWLYEKDANLIQERIAKCKQSPVTMFHIREYEKARQLKV